MSILDVFRQDAFSTMQLTSYVEKYPFLPKGLGALNIFEPLPIRTTALAVEERNGVLVIVPTSQRGAPATERVTEKRKMRYFEVPRLAFGDTVFAGELQNIREFGSETVLMQLQAEVARRLSGPTGLQNSMELTRERHRLGALQGLLLDADGSTLYDWFAEFGVTQPTEVAFDLGAKTVGSLKPKIAAVVRGMARASAGAITETTKIRALCGDDFWDLLVTHPDVEKTYLNWSDSVALREGVAFESMYFGGVYWSNYRGSDDNSTGSVAVGVTKAKFFPDGAPGVFQRALAPGESFDWVNTPGKEEYVVPIIDKDRNSWWRQELYSYPLHICTRPAVLYSGRSGA